jgi:iron complex transport system permease protein
VTALPEPAVAAGGRSGSRPSATGPGTPAGRAHPARLPVAWLLGATAFTLVAAGVAVSFGPASVPVGEVGRSLLDLLPGVRVDHDLQGPLAAIVTEVRLPRVVLAALVGSILAAAGGAYQATFGNPLADPYLLGVAAGAGLGVTISLTGTGDALGQGGLISTGAAFAGALVAVVAAYLLGRDAERARTTASLILAGVAVAALCSALQAFLLQRDDEAVRDVYGWLLGRFNVAGWTQVRLLAPVAAVSIGAIVAAGRRLDVLGLGDDEATSLGIDPARVRRWVVAAATLGTAAAVAVSGLIGFVGIIVPHALRLLTGPSYRRILPLAAIAGAGFLCLADLAARSALAPAEIPIGVVTAIVGAPTFLLILRTRRR